MGCIAIARQGTVPRALVQTRRAENGILRAETLRFEDELRKPEDVGLPKVQKPAPASVKKLDPHILLDEYVERLEKLVAQKEKKKADIVKAPEEVRDEDEGGGEVVDLLAVLSRSLGGSAKATTTKKRAPAKKAPAKKSAKKKTTAKKKKAS